MQQLWYEVDSLSSKTTQILFRFFRSTNIRRNFSRSHPTLKIHFPQIYSIQARFAIDFFTFCTYEYWRIVLGIMFALKRVQLTTDEDIDDRSFLTTILTTNRGYKNWSLSSASLMIDHANQKLDRRPTCVRHAPLLQVFARY